LLQALAYVPFYFDGNYPGGGARFLAEVIPLAQILVARTASELRWGWLAPVVSVLGFFGFARHGHEELRDREGGRPMFEPAVLEGAGVKRGLVLVGTDHGFNLGHLPGVDPSRGVLVARARGDAHDRELYERLGAPPTYRYEFDFRARKAPSVVPFVPPASTRYEAEAEWPALLRRGGAYPTYYPCASAGRGLRLVPHAVVALPLAALRGSESLRLGWLAKTSERSRLSVRWTSSSAQQLLEPSGPGCSTYSLRPPPPGSGPPLLVELASGEGALDYIELAPDDNAGRAAPRGGPDRP
jgi:hypothetical protein